MAWQIIRSRKRICSNGRSHHDCLENGQALLNIHPCPECGNSFSARNWMLQHIKSIHVVIVYVCMVCGKSYRSCPTTSKHLTCVNDWGIQVMYTS